MQLISSMISLGVNAAITVMILVGFWKIFVKAGEKGWKSLIPVYNAYILCKIAGKAKAFVGYIAGCVVMVLGYIVMIIGMLMLIAMLGTSGYYGFAATSTVRAYASVIIEGAGLIWIGIIPLFVMNIIVYIGLVRKFGLAGGWVAGLIFLPYVFFLIMGLNKNIEYEAEEHLVYSRATYTPNRAYDNEPIWPEYTTGGSYTDENK